MQNSNISNTNSDIEEHLADFLKYRDQFERISKGKENFSLVITNLTEEISGLKLSERNLMKQLQLYTNSDDQQNRINCLYGKLRDRYNELDRKYNKLEKKHLFIQQNHSIELLELQDKFIMEKDVIAGKHLEQTKLLEIEISEKNVQLKSKDKKLADELERLQSTYGFHYDEMESYLKSQIRDATYKLQESIESNNMLREELIRFKSNEGCQLEALKENSKKLEKKIRTLEVELEDARQKLKNGESKNVETDKFNLSLGNKNVNLIKNASDGNPNCLESRYNKEHKYESLNKSKTRDERFTNTKNLQSGVKVDRDCGPPRKNFAPPLLQLNVNLKNTRKRKLHNPNSSGSENFKELQD